MYVQLTMKLLQNKDIAGRSIGDWTANTTPDGTVVWTKPKKLFKKASPIGVYATPHYDQMNRVSVDVVSLNADRTTLSTHFYLKGEFLASDLKLYLVNMQEIFSMLK